MKQFFLACVIALAFTAPLSAQAPENTISASDPSGIVDTLSGMGLNPELTTGPNVDAIIASREGWRLLVVLFTGCDETSHHNCQSIRLQVGFDRGNPWTHVEAMELSDRFRYLAVRLDEEGDPFVHSDLFLGDGIPETVFIRNVSAFTQSVVRAAEVIYAEDRAEKEQSTSGE